MTSTEEQSFYRVMGMVEEFVSSNISTVPPSILERVFTIFHQLGYNPSDTWLWDVVVHVSDNIHRYQPGNLAAMVRGFLARDVDEIDARWLERILPLAEKQYMGPAAASNFSLEELHRLMSWLVAYHVSPPPVWLERFTDIAARHIQDGNAKLLLSTFTFLSSLGHLPCPGVREQLYQGLDARVKVVKVGEALQWLEVLKTMPPRETESVVRKLLLRLLTSSYHMSSREVLHMLCMSAAIQQPLPPDYVEVFVLQLRVRPQQFTSQEYLDLLWALAQHKYKVRPAFASSLLIQLQRMLPQLQFGELAGLIGSMSRVSIRPPPQWMQIFFNALDHEKNQWSQVALLADILVALERLNCTPPRSLVVEMKSFIQEQEHRMGPDLKNKFRKLFDRLEIDVWGALDQSALMRKGDVVEAVAEETELVVGQDERS